LGCKINQALEQWETKTTNSKDMPLAIWPIAKSLIKRDGTKTPNTIHGPLGLKFHPLKKANRIAGYTKNSSCPMTYDENPEWRVKTRVQILLEALDTEPLKG
jgi:hypothetical protein